MGGWLGGYGCALGSGGRGEGMGTGMARLEEGEHGKVSFRSEAEAAAGSILC